MLRSIPTLLAPKFCSGRRLTLPPWTMPYGVWPWDFEIMEDWIKERHLPVDAGAEFPAFNEGHGLEEGVSARRPKQAGKSGER